MITESLDGASQLLKANSESASTMVAGRGFHCRMVFKNRTLWDGHLSSVALLFGWIGGHPYWCMLLIWKSSNYLQITKQLFEDPKHWASHWYNIITKVTLVQCPGVYLSRPCLSATGSRQSPHSESSWSGSTVSKKDQVPCVYWGALASRVGTGGEW